MAKVQATNRSSTSKASCDVFQIRPFRNSDPPHLAAIWRSQPPQRGLAQPINASMLELCVFSKQFFDPEGLLVATRDEVPVGFAHASFGPNDECTCLDTTLGTTQLLLVHDDLVKEKVADACADALIAASEIYQRSQGTKVHYAGGVYPLNGFYMGLYGGSELPGLLDTDPVQTAHFLRNGYSESARVVVMQRQLTRLRTFGSRDARRIKRETDFVQTFLPPAKNWWEACVTGSHDRMRFALQSRATSQEIASVIFWDIEPLATAWGIPTVGMIDLYVDPENRRHKTATYLLSEALRHIQRRGAAMVEAQTMADNLAAIGLYESLGFTTIDSGSVLRRDSSS